VREADTFLFHLRPITGQLIFLISRIDFVLDHQLTSHPGAPEVDVEVPEIGDLFGEHSPSVTRDERRQHRAARLLPAFRRKPLPKDAKEQLALRMRAHWIQEIGEEGRMGPDLPPRKAQNPKDIEVRCLDPCAASRALLQRKQCFTEPLEFPFEFTEPHS
jgi:hypothetical protein